MDPIGDAFRGIFGALLMAVASIGSCAGSFGCSPGSEAIERFSQTTLKEAIAPAVTKALAETSARTAQLQAGAQAINPGYVIVAEGKICQGFEGKFIVRTDGLAVQIQGNAQADQGQAATVPPPAIRDDGIGDDSGGDLIPPAS